MIAGLRVFILMRRAWREPHGIALCFMARPLALLLRATLSPASESNREGRERRNEEWTGARDGSHLFTLNDFQKRRNIEGEEKKKRPECRFLCWFPAADLLKHHRRGETNKRAMVRTSWKSERKQFALVPQESHSVNSDLWSWCLVMKRSCLFRQKVDGSRIPQVLQFQRRARYPKRKCFNAFSLRMLWNTLDCCTFCEVKRVGKVEGGRGKFGNARG